MNFCMYDVCENREVGSGNHYYCWKGRGIRNLMCCHVKGFMKTPKRSVIYIVDPQCMRVTVVVPCVCVTKVVATYLVYKSKVWFYKVPYGVPNA